MPRLSIEARRRIVLLYSCGCSVPSIVQRLEQEDVEVSKRAVYDLVKKFRLKGVVKDLPRRKKARILTYEMKMFIEEELQKNDELTSTAINTSLIRKWPDLRVSVSTIKRVRREMGWVCTRPHYCQLLREVWCCYEAVYLITYTTRTFMFLCSIFNTVLYMHACFKTLGQQEKAAHMV